MKSRGHRRPEACCILQTNDSTREVQTAILWCSYSVSDTSYWLLMAPLPLTGQKAAQSCCCSILRRRWSVACRPQHTCFSYNNIIVLSMDLWHEVLRIWLVIDLLVWSHISQLCVLLTVHCGRAGMCWNVMQDWDCSTCENVLISMELSSTKSDELLKQSVSGCN